MRTSEVYGREPGTIAAARRLAAAFLARVGGEGVARISTRVIETVQLVVSELVTNAAKYTVGPFGLDLEVVDDTVEISVWDTSPDRVTAPSADPQRAGRHGMEIVTALCGGFDVVHSAFGKRITVRMDLRAATGG